MLRPAPRHRRSGDHGGGQWPRGFRGGPAALGALALEKTPMGSKNGWLEADGNHN